MRATCWADKLIRAAPQTMINHEAKSVQLRNELQMEQRSLAQLCSTSQNSKERRYEEERIPSEASE
jgi:hypothetical protein